MPGIFNRGSSGSNSTSTGSGQSTKRGSSGGTIGGALGRTVNPTLAGPGMGNHAGEDAHMALYEMARQGWEDEWAEDNADYMDGLSDWERAIAKQQEKLNQGFGNGAQSEYNSAMSNLASNYAIYERLMNASADDTNQDIKDLIDEAAQSEELAALEEASGYGMEYVNRGDIGTGIAGMDINPQGNYVSGDAAALLRMSQEMSEQDKADLETRHGIGNEYINELAGLTDELAKLRMSEASQVRAIQEQRAAEQLRKRQAAAARQRAAAEERLAELMADRDDYVDKNGISLDDFISGKSDDLQTERRIAAYQQLLADGEKENQFFDFLNSPTAQADPLLTFAALRNDDGRFVADRLIDGGASGYSSDMSDEQLLGWFQNNRGS